MKSGDVIASRYQLAHLLTTRRTTEVWDALDLEDASQVVLKLLRSSSADEPNARARVEREGRTLSRVSHPNIVRFHARGEHEGRPFVAMERLVGRSLHATLEAEGALPFSSVRDLGFSLADALVAMHEKGILHRDLKPDNIWIGPNRARILDFGLACEGNADAITNEKEGVTGAPAYLAPERWLGLPASTQTDVYALGAVLHEAITGAPLIQAPNPFVLRTRALAGDHDGRDQVTEPMRGLLAQALARTPERRPTAHVFRDSLRAI